MHFARASLIRALVPVLCGFFCVLLSTGAATATNPPGLGAGDWTSVGHLDYYAHNQRYVTMTADAGATIYYTTNGTDPTTGSTVYSGGTTGVLVPNLTTVKAMASLAGVNSAVTTTIVNYDVPRKNLQLWLTPDNIVTSGSNITGWNDISGNAVLVSQGTSANQPTVVTNSLYGYQAASFNGATTNSSYLTVTQASTVTPFLNDLTGGVSIFAVVSPLTSAAAKALFSCSKTGVTDLTALSTNGTNAIFDANNGVTASNVTTTTGPVTVGTFQTLDAVHNGAASAKIDVDGALITSGTVQNLANTTRPVTYIGGNNALTSTAFWGGKLVEMLVYGRGLSTSEAASVSAYLANKYQVATSQSTPTPIISVATSTLSAPTNVAIAAPPNATTYITLDGTAPTTSSQVYSQPVRVNYSLTLKAMSVANGVQSAVATSVYTLDSTKYPAPDPANTSALQINLQLPTVSVPQ
ncbi:MAG: chitobiase/beta-hexosaminidase C-terminal domain-containing protein [Cyanobacteria bacterium SZAS TMP-1]|nr:chitobiase/beta-hexosaminidase C-terminal domain-containing protein [Cyanobacteria bacterium SZAS TMP-1]